MNYKAMKEQLNFLLQQVRPLADELIAAGQMEERSLDLDPLYIETGVIEQPQWPASGDLSLPRKDGMVQSRWFNEALSGNTKANRWFLCEETLTNSPSPEGEWNILANGAEARMQIQFAPFCWIARKMLRDPTGQSLYIIQKMIGDGFALPVSRNTAVRPWKAEPYMHYLEGIVSEIMAGRYPPGVGNNSPESSQP